jgi:hypothetical protein
MPEQPARKAVKITRGLTLKVLVNRLQRSMTNQLNEWRNDKLAPCWKALIQRTVTLEAE